MARTRKRSRLEVQWTFALFFSQEKAAIPHRIKKELSICQSLICLDLVSFPVLSHVPFTQGKLTAKENSDRASSELQTPSAPKLRRRPPLAPPWVYKGGFPV